MSLKPFREIPKTLVEWERWMKAQSEEVSEDGDFTNLTADTATLGDVTITGDFVLEDTYWDDLRFPATLTALPPGQSANPDVDPDTALLLFDAGSTEFIFAFVQMPHAWKEGTAIFPHVHWQKTTSAGGDVVWRCEYKLSPIGEVMDAAWTAQADANTPVESTPDTDTADYHMITSWDDISMTGLGLSDCLLFRISRIGGDGADTYGADARLLEFDVHYEINSFGSDDEFRQ